MSQSVPESWWKAACEVIHHPIACVLPDDHFLWVNGGFEKLTGYSLAELKEMRWQDITVNEDIGADLKNVQAIIRGDDTQYTMLKRYRHKKGHIIPIELTVWRHPLDANQDLKTFIAEAVPEKITADQLEKIRKDCQECMIVVQQRFKVLERAVRKRERIAMGKDRNTHDTNVNVGNNSTEVFRWIVIAIIVLVGAVSYLTYIAGWDFHGGKAKPPNGISVPE